MQLNGKVALITGAARGIGAETTRALVARGAKVVATDVDDAALKELAADLGEDNVYAVVADVVDLEAMQAAVDGGVERFGGLDFVIANAGIASYGSVLQVDPATFKRVLDINVLGVFHTVRAALPAVIERRGYILVVSSLAAFAPAPGLAAYNASKAGSSTSPTRCGSRSPIRESTVGCAAHVLDRHSPGAGREARPDGVQRDAQVAARPAQQDHVGGCLRHGLRRRTRQAQAPRLRARLGRRIAKGRTAVTSRIGERETLKHVPRLLPLMDEEVRRLGRSTSARNLPDE